MHVRKECCKLGASNTASNNNRGGEAEGPPAALLQLEGADVLDLHDFVRTQQEAQANMRNVVSTLSQVGLSLSLIIYYLPLTSGLASADRSCLQRCGSRVMR